MQRKHFVTTILLTVLIAITMQPAAASTGDIGDFGFAKRTACETSLSRSNIFLAASNNLATALAGPRVFQGCWTFYSAGPCRAIYTKNGSYQICGECDDFGNPGSGGCSPISSATLNQGYWCS